MVKAQPATLDDAFRVRANPNRRAILDLLAAGDRKVSQEAAHFAESLPWISRHVALL